MAEIRKQALLASGAQIEGLQGGTGAPATKKVVYGNRKKKGPIAKDISPASSRPRSPEPELPVAIPPPAEVPIVVTETGAPDSWDASTDDEVTKPAVPEGVKDSWDDSSDDETKKIPAAIPKAAPTLTPNKLKATGESNTVSQDEGC